jgi:hypothetical protein
MYMHWNCIAGTASRGSPQALCRPGRRVRGRVPAAMPAEVMPSAALRIRLPTHTHTHTHTHTISVVAHGWQPVTCHMSHEPGNLLFANRRSSRPYEKHKAARKSWRDIPSPPCSIRLSIRIFSVAADSAVGPLPCLLLQIKRHHMPPMSLQFHFPPRTCMPHGGLMISC